VRSAGLGMRTSLRGRGAAGCVVAVGEGGGVDFGLLSWRGFVSLVGGDGGVE
jgi:hypothetical protein